jgi:hypothetical protein
MRIRRPAHPRVLLLGLNFPVTGSHSAFIWYRAARTGTVPDPDPPAVCERTQKLRS